MLTLTVLHVADTVGITVRHGSADTVVRAMNDFNGKLFVAWGCSRCHEANCCAWFDCRTADFTCRLVDLYVIELIGLLSFLYILRFGINYKKCDV